MLLWCWASVADGGPTLQKHWVNVYSPVLVSTMIRNCVSEYCLTSLPTESLQYRERIKTEAWTMPYPYFKGSLLCTVRTIGSTVHPMPLNSLEHCVCTTTMINISGPTGIRAWYLQVNSPSRYEGAIGAGPQWLRMHEKHSNWINA